MEQVPRDPETILHGTPRGHRDDGRRGGRVPRAQQQHRRGPDVQEREQPSRAKAVSPVRARLPQLSGDFEGDREGGFRVSDAYPGAGVASAVERRGPDRDRADRNR